MADPKAAPPPPAEPWWKRRSFRNGAATVLAFILAAVCPLIPNPAVRAVCGVAATIVKQIPGALDTSTQGPGQLGCAGEEVCDDATDAQGRRSLFCRCSSGDAGQ